jgi:hypothetical protein
LANEFELAIHEISHITNAIDGLHIPNLVPIINEKKCYWQKSFYLVLLQSIVDIKCLFWGYEFRWTWNMHDWNLFKLTKAEEDCRKKNLPYN